MDIWGISIFLVILNNDAMNLHIQVFVFVALKETEMKIVFFLKKLST